MTTSSASICYGRGHEVTCLWDLQVLMQARRACSATCCPSSRVQWLAPNMAMSVPTTSCSSAAAPSIPANLQTCLRSCRGGSPSGSSSRASREHTPTRPTSSMMLPIALPIMPAGACTSSTSLQAVLHQLYQAICQGVCYECDCATGPLYSSPLFLARESHMSQTNLSR